MGNSGTRAGGADKAVDKVKQAVKKLRD